MLVQRSGCDRDRLRRCPAGARDCAGGMPWLIRNGRRVSTSGDDVPLARLRRRN